MTIVVSQTVFAVGSEAGPQGILPAPGPSKLICEEAMQTFFAEDRKTQIEDLKDSAVRQDILGCALKTGQIRLWMAPFYITSLIQFLIGLAGLVAVIFIIVGGYKYVIGGLTDDKESGKKTIKFAIIGLVVSLLAWIIVNIIQVQITR